MPRGTRELLLDGQRIVAQVEERTFILLVDCVDEEKDVGVLPAHHGELALDLAVAPDAGAFGEKETVGVHTDGLEGLGGLRAVPSWRGMEADGGEVGVYGEPAGVEHRATCLGGGEQELALAGRRFFTATDHDEKCEKTE